jgi:hypothetical protein
MVAVLTTPSYLPADVSEPVRETTVGGILCAAAAQTSGTIALVEGSPEPRRTVQPSCVRPAAVQAATHAWYEGGLVTRHSKPHRSSAQVVRHYLIELCRQSRAPIPVAAANPSAWKVRAHCA